VEPLATNVEEPDLPHMWLDLTKATTGGQESMLKICGGVGERGARREGKRERGYTNGRLAPPLPFVVREGRRRPEMDGVGGRLKLTVEESDNNSHRCL
jgi:hypothetical protein